MATGHTPGLWQVAAFDIPVRMRTSDSQRSVTIAGWRNGVFGLDFRIWPDEANDWVQPGWQITHIPTGHSVFAALVDLGEAQSIADAIAEMADWHFTDAADAAKLTGVAAQVRERFSDKVTRETPAFSPAFMMKATSPEGASA